MRKFTSALTAIALVLGLGAASASDAASSTATLTIHNNTGSTITVVTGSPTQCIGTVLTPPGFSSPILSGSTGTVTATSTLTSNGCSLTYKRSDNLATCHWAATRIESGLPPAPWNFPTINSTPTGTIMCSGSVTSTSANGDWSGSLTAAP